MSGLGPMNRWRHRGLECKPQLLLIRGRSQRQPAKRHQIDTWRLNSIPVRGMDVRWAPGDRTYIEQVAPAFGSDRSSRLALEFPWPLYPHSTTLFVHSAEL